MVGLGRKGEVMIECPFCEKAMVRVFHKEGYIQGRQSRISAGAKFTFHAIPEKHEVLEDCAKCGKTRKEIQDFLDGKTKKGVDPKKLRERLKDAGLPTKVDLKVS